MYSKEINLAYLHFGDSEVILRIRFFFLFLKYFYTLLIFIIFFKCNCYLGHTCTHILAGLKPETLLTAKPPV